MTRAGDWPLNHFVSFLDFRQFHRLPSEASLQRFPFDHKAPASGFVLLYPPGEKIEAGVVDVGQMIEIDVEFRVAGDPLQRRRQLR